MLLYSGLSFLIHILLFFLILFHQTKFQIKEPKKRPVPHSIEINLLTDIAKPKAQNSRKEKKDLALSKAKLKFVTSQFSPLKMKDIMELKTSGDYDNGENKSNMDNPRDRWGAGGGQFGRLKNYRQIKMVADKIDGLIEYPPALSYRRIGGVIRARMVINDQGQCNWTDSYILGTNPLLRFYVLSSLKTFCRNPMWHGHRKKKSSNIDFSFDFNTYSKEPFNIKVLGNVILVHLPGKQERGNWRLGPIQGHFAFPTFVLLNPTWVVENWNKLIYDEDPLQRFQETQQN